MCGLAATCALLMLVWCLCSAGKCMVMSKQEMLSNLYHLYHALGLSSKQVQQVFQHGISK
ncbi:hypothetical protein [Snodgrassella alvi]|uniref:hypothetical protein n=1 Tax=Snodgrassella alvi TaxID=1196083 RepID=UPI0011869318|nr:hypothetical protein [Snodgrassella alvi]